MIEIKHILFVSIILLSQTSFSQTDSEALRILDKFSEKAMTSPSVSMKFHIITNDQTDSSADTLPASIILSKDRYRLDLPDNIIWFNGTTSWSYLPAEKEVTINNADKKDMSFQNRPSAIFSVYKDGYKSRLIEEKNNNYIIDLYPEDIKSELIRIRLAIGKSLSDLKSLEYKKKDGITVILKIEEYNLTIKPDQNTFTYQSALYKGVEIIDLR